MARFRCFGLLFASSCLLATTLLYAEGRKVIKKVPPQYPVLATKMRVGGTVKLEAEVDADGSVGEVKVVSGHELLKAAAVDCLKKWKYEPGTDKSMEVVIVEFKLPN